MSSEQRGPPVVTADARIARWIGRELSRHPPKAKSLVVTVWGDAIAPHGGAVWLSDLIRLLAPLGLNERLVRTSVYRLAREGWLTARQDGRRSLYRLTASGFQRFEHAYRRIYAPPAGDWDGTWDIVLAPTAALAAPERRDLRRELGWEGFGPIATGVFGRPAHDRTASSLAEILAALDLEHRVVVLEGRDAPGFTATSLQAYARECWDLRRVGAEYRAFLARFEAGLRLFRAGRAVSPEHCFVVRSLLIHGFRRVMLHDPQLPAELLSAHWPGPRAYAVCRDFYRLTHQRAEQYLAATLETESRPLPRAADYFHQRFGGL